jgi:hypothetical protein
MKDYGVFAATRLLAMPKGWLIPKALADSPRTAAAALRLAAHAWHQDLQEITGSDRSWYRWSAFRSMKSPRRRDLWGRQGNCALERHAFDRAQLSIERRFAASSLADQPLARLAFYLIEPERTMTAFVTSM